jgi:gamma-glutamylcyclotransferase
VKGAEFVGVGVLKGFELTFYDHGRRWCGAAASIEPNSDSEVWGCVWRVPNTFSDELDLQEASYHRLSVSIHIPSHNNTEVVCRTYQYTHHTNMERLPPSPHYKHVIVSGAIEHSLPDDYVAKLKAILDNGYKGPIPLKLRILEELNSVHVEEEGY